MSLADYSEEAKSTGGKLPYRSGDKNKKYLFLL